MHAMHWVTSFAAPVRPSSCNLSMSCECAGLRKTGAAKAEDANEGAQAAAPTQVPQQAAAGIAKKRKSVRFTIPPKGAPLHHVPPPVSTCSASKHHTVYQQLAVNVAGQTLHGSQSIWWKTR